MKNYNVGKQFSEIETLINEVFKQQGQPPLLNNPLFRVDSELSNEFGYCIRTIQREDRMDIMFFLGDFGMEFHIDNTDEIPEYSYKWVKENEEAFKQGLAVIFTSPVEITHQGTKTVIRFLDKNNAEKQRLTYRRGFTPNFLYQPKVKLYRPIFGD